MRVVEDGCQFRGGVDGKDVVTSCVEQSLIRGEKISNGRRGSCRRGPKRGQTFIELFTGDADPILVFLSFQNKHGRDNLNFMLFDEVGGQIGGRVGDDSKFHG